MACSLKLLDYIKSENPGKVIPAGGVWTWEGGSSEKCTGFDTGNGTDPGALVGDNPCIDVSGWSQMYYKFVYDTGKAFHYLVVNVKARPNAGCDTKMEMCENDSAINLIEQLGCSPDEGGTWYLLNSEGVTGTIDIENGTYAPAEGDGGSLLRFMYGFGGNQEGQCCQDSCQSAAVLEIKINECGCEDLHVILRRDKNELIADYTGCGNTITPEFRWYQDQVKIEGETGSSINFVGYGDGDFLVKVICGDCEEQDRFFSGETCAYPEIISVDIDDESEPYDVTVDVRYMTGSDTIDIKHRYNVTEDGYDENDIDTFDLSGNDLTFEITPGYGHNQLIITLTNSCGTISETFDFYKDCIDDSPGVTTLITTCQGCWDTLAAIDFLDGSPDEGGEWEDVLLSGQLEDGDIHFDQLNEGLWEFRYTVNQDYASCATSASLFVEVLSTKDSGENTAVNICHDAGETTLIDLLAGTPEAGGEWYTDDSIDGTIDLVNGTITPASTDIGKTITLAYSHEQEVSELPDGVGLECALVFNGTSSYAEARNTTDLEFELPIKIKFEATGNRFTVFSKIAGSLVSNTYTVNAPADGRFGFLSKSSVTQDYRYAFGFPGGILEYHAYLDGGDFVQDINGSLFNRKISPELPSGSSPGKFTLGRLTGIGDGYYLGGKIYPFQHGTEIFPLSEGSGTTITGSEGTIIDLYNVTWDCQGALPCNCSTFSLLTITIEDCTPPIPCPDDSGLGIDIDEETNGSPSDAQWQDMLTITKTGTYDDAGVVATDGIYQSNDDGDTWTELTEVSGEYFVKDDDYYVKLSSGFDTNCNFSGSTGSHEMINVILSNGEDVQEGQVRSRNGNFNNNWTDIESSDELKVSGASSSLIAERFFRWDVNHVLNSGWNLHITRTHFDRGNSGGTCPNGISGFGEHTNSGDVSGKRKILVERRITYNNGCDPITIEAEFNPTLPDCEPVGSSVGFSITDPYKIGSSEYTGSVQCSGSVAGSTSDKIYVYEQPTGAPGFSESNFNCGGSDYVYFNYSYFFLRIILFDDCPPIILTRNYNAPTSCSTATITCTKDDANARAKATRLSTPSNTASEYMQYRRGAGSWNSYSEGQWIYVTGTENVSFRRIANYNNGCPQTTSSCSTTVTPPTHSLSISCSTNTIVVSASGMPPGGTYFLYRDGIVVTSNTTGANFTIGQNGDYQVKYKYNQYQEIVSNVVDCGTSGGGCTPPTVSIGACNIVNGNEIRIPFSTTDVSSIGQIAASVDPGSGSFTWNSGTGQGTLIVTGTPGQSYDFEVVVTTPCGTDTATRTCQIGCSTLSFDNVTCDFANDRTTFDVIVSPDTGDIPTTNGTYLSEPSSGRYRFRINQTTGTITASHPTGCSGISQSINCQCPEPIVNMSLSCTNNQVSYSFTVSNESSVSGDYKLKLGSTIYTIPNTSAGSYSGTISRTGLSHTYDFYYTACGDTEHDTGTITCSCQSPSISASASCTSTTVDYSFTVTNEDQATSNYTILLNGAAVETVTRTGSGTYTGDVTVAGGSNNTIQVRVSSVCGGTVTSNIASANCACAAAALSISGVSCDSETQILTFTVNQTNITGLQIKVNGGNITPGSNPHTAQGVSGNNTILVTGTDSCASTGLQDSVTYNCGCDQPSIALTASCNTSGVVSYEFVVTDEDRMNGNYRVIIDGVLVETITKTGAGTYNDTWAGSPGNNYTVRVEGENKCSGTTKSNTVGTSCGCPTATLSITSVSCNSSNQEVTFTVNGSNVTDREVKVNGVVVPVTLGVPKTVQGQIGSNMVVVTAEDGCTGDPMTDSVTLTCNCTNEPTVTLGSASESSGTITVPITTTNISSASQITFVANGSNRTVTGSGSSYSVSFPALTGTNSFIVTVANDCGDDTDSDTYSHVPCVAPTITKIRQGTTFGGAFYVDFSTQNCSSISAPGTANIVTCQSTRAEWNTTSSVLNWSITVNNGCGSDVISGSYNPCTACDATITNLGCASTPVDIDFLFLVDHSSSIDNPDFNSIQSSVRNTMSYIDSNSSGVHRYAIAEFHNDEAGPSYGGLMYATPVRSGNRFTTFSNAYSDAINWTRSQATCANWGLMYSAANSDLGSQLIRRSGKQLHVIIFHDSGDARDGGYCSASGQLSARNSFLFSNSNTVISVVRYEDPSGGATNNLANYMSATHASVGGTWGLSGSQCVGLGCVNYNPGSSDSQVLPRRMYYRNTISSSPITDLVDDIFQDCKLRVDLDGGCNYGVSSYSWAASAGGAITGLTTLPQITTNGTGTYTVTITLSNGCTVEKTFNY